MSKFIGNYGSVTFNSECHTTSSDAPEYVVNKCYRQALGAHANVWYKVFSVALCVYESGMALSYYVNAQVKHDNVFIALYHRRQQ